MLEKLGILGRLRDHARALTAAPADLPGIDVSHHQGDIDWTAVAKSGVRFAYVRSTQGVDFLDRKLTRNAAELSGMPEISRGYYHFGSWWTTRQNVVHDAHLEAEFFVSTCLKADSDAFCMGRMPPMLDVELTEKGSADGRRMTYPKVAAWIHAFCTRCDELTGRKTGIYTGRYFIYGDPRTGSNGLGFANVPQFADRSLWLAQYSRRAEPPKPIEGWPAAMWQFTGSGSCPGIKGRVDRNRFMGNVGDWMRFLGYPDMRMVLPSWNELNAANS